MDEQLELPLEWAKYAVYAIEVRTGPREEVVRAHKAESVEDAVNLIEGLRDFYAARDEVVWQDEEVNAGGRLYGLAPGGVVWLIEVTPSLTTPLTPS